MLWSAKLATVDVTLLFVFTCAFVPIIFAKNGHLLQAFINTNGSLRDSTLVNLIRKRLTYQLTNERKMNLQSVSALKQSACDELAEKETKGM